MVNCLRFLLLLMAFGAAPRVIVADETPLTLIDVFALQYASDPRLSPDGDRVVYVRRSMDIMKDKGRSQLWVCDVSGENHRPLTGEWGESSPRWSPDGTRIAYVASDPDTEKAQLFVQWVDAETRTAITQLTEGPSDHSWSRDGRRLAFICKVAASAPKPIFTLPSAPAGAEWADPPRVIEELVYRRDGSGYGKPGNRHVFVVAADGGAPRQLTDGEFDHSGPLSWSAAGDALYLAANRKPNWRFENDTEVVRLSLNDGALTSLTDRHGPDGHPVVSPDGEWIAYLGHDEAYQGYQIDQLHLMRIDGSEKQVLAETLDRSVDEPQWNSDGSRIFVRYEDQGVGRVASVDRRGAHRVVLSDVGGTSVGRPYSGGSYHTRGNTLVSTQAGPGRLADVAVSKVSSTTVRRLTRLNDDLFAQRALGEVKELWSKSPDGRQIQSWLITPPGYDGAAELPLILEIHGGPFASYGPRFAMELQLFAAAGYAVLYVNPRGSTSYGAEFGNLIHHAYPGDDYGDLMGAVDHVIANENIDEERLFVTGGSGGGVLTAWIVGKTRRFRAAVVAKPVINWFSFVLTADAYPFFSRYWFPDKPWNAVQHYYERSPISLVGEVETPTMLLTGEEDYRTPISESEQYYQALKLRGIDAAMVRIPGASHGITSRPSRLMAKVAAILGWFERYDTAREDRDAEQNR